VTCNSIRLKYKVVLERCKITSSQFYKFTGTAISVIQVGRYKQSPVGFQGEMVCNTVCSLKFNLITVAGKRKVGFSFCGNEGNILGVGCIVFGITAKES